MEALIYIGPIIGGIIGYLIISSLVRTPGVALSKKFVSLGDMKGMTYEQIKSVVGPCSSISDIGNGQKLRQWIATGYHIALVFDSDDKMIKISHEAAA